MEGYITILLLLLLMFFTTTCNPEAPITPTIMAQVSTPTLESTPRPLAASTPKPTNQPTPRPPATSTSRPTNEPIVAPTPTLTKDRIYIMGWGWADNTKEFDDDMVNTIIRGAGLEKMEITLESNVDVSILVSIIPGTLFETISVSVQTMVARELREITLEPYAEISLELDVACASMHLDAPSLGDSFTAVWPPTIPNLSKLVSSRNFLENESFRVQQFAVWVITDGGFVPLGSVGTGSGPSEDEMRQIRHLFESAGISVGEYSVLN
jgi:hypothetical protein